MKRLIKQNLLFIFLIALLANCHKAPTEPKDDDHLLNDEELATASDPNAPPENDHWVAWIKANNDPIRSLTSENYADLQFLKPILSERRLVQLGESGHGVAEFNKVKVRLIKFLHQEMGYEVIAFESSIFECFNAYKKVNSLSARDLIKRSIFGVWHTSEVLPLFEYLKQTAKSGRPLVLAGFDVQVSSPLEVDARPQFFQEIVAKIDGNYAREVYSLDSTFVALIQRNFLEFEAYVIAQGEQLAAAYEKLVAFIDRHKVALIEAFPDDSRIPHIARQAAWSMLQFIAQMRAHESGEPVLRTRIRDEGMANNISFLLDDLYPNKKIMVWAHNFHIRHKNIEIPEYPALKTMGAWVAERHRPILFSIGLYMYRGNAAKNNRQIYSVQPAVTGSLESIFYHTRRKFSFVDFLHQQRNDGNSWMFEKIKAKEWGYNDLTMAPRDQYDAVIFIDTVSPPVYLQ